MSFVASGHGTQMAKTKSLTHHNTTNHLHPNIRVTMAEGFEVNYVNHREPMESSSGCSYCLPGLQVHGQLHCSVLHNLHSR